MAPHDMMSLRGPVCPYVAPASRGPMAAMAVPPSKEIEYRVVQNIFYFLMYLSIVKENPERIFLKEIIF